MAIQVAIVFIVFIISMIIAYLVGLNAQIKAMRDHLAATAARAEFVLNHAPDVHQRLTSLERKTTGLSRQLAEFYKRPSRQSFDHKNARHM